MGRKEQGLESKVEEPLALGKTLQGYNITYRVLVQHFNSGLETLKPCRKRKGRI